MTNSLLTEDIGDMAACFETIKRARKFVKMMGKAPTSDTEQQYLKITERLAHKYKTTPIKHAKTEKSYFLYGSVRESCCFPVVRLVGHAWPPCVALLQENFQCAPHRAETPATRGSAKAST
jgi:hypothetical protein